MMFKFRQHNEKIIKLVKRIEKIRKEIKLETDDLEIELLNAEVNEIEEKIARIKFTIPNNWEEENKKFNNINSNLNKTKLNYNKTVDSSYNEISNFIKKFQNVDKLNSIDKLYDKLIKDVNHESKNIEKIIKDFEKNKNLSNKIPEIIKGIAKPNE